MGTKIQIRQAPKSGENGKNSPFVYFGLNLGILYYISEISGSSDRSGEKQKLPTPLCKKSKFVMTCSWLPMHVSTNIKSLYNFYAYFQPKQAFAQTFESLSASKYQYAALYYSILYSRRECPLPSDVRSSPTSPRA